jgi:hypothetical protein
MQGVCRQQQNQDFFWNGPGDNPVGALDSTLISGLDLNESMMGQQRHKQERI